LRWLRDASPKSGQVHGQALSPVAHHQRVVETKERAGYQRQTTQQRLSGDDLLLERGAGAFAVWLDDPA
jgi:hypothetical protein